MIINREKCNNCGFCIDVCTLGAISFVDGEPEISEDCTNCQGCLPAIECSLEAIERPEGLLAGNVVRCQFCPVICEIKPNKTGACQRFVNQDGTLFRNIPLTRYEEVEEIVEDRYHPAIQKPLLTGIGAGTTTLIPPAPYIVQDTVEGVDVITCVTECPFTASRLNVKIDTHRHIGEEGAKILYKGKKIGMILSTEEFRLLTLGGLKTLAGKYGAIAAKVMADIANRKRVSLEVEGGSRLELQVGKAPIIDGNQDVRMPYGTGMSVSGMMVEEFQKAADEVIVMDGIVTAHFGMPLRDNLWAVDSGIRLRFRASGGFFINPQGGAGWGGTNMEDPLEMIESIDVEKIKPGFTLLITDTLGERYALYEFTEEKKFKQIEMTSNAKKVIDIIREGCEPARVSAYFIANAGGSARANITRRPLRLTEAIKAKRARLTIGGAPVFITPGGGIEFMVDVEKVKTGAFTWQNVGAVVAPMEYVMTLKDYKDIGGFIESVKPLQEMQEMLKNRQIRFSSKDRVIKF